MRGTAKDAIIVGTTLTLTLTLTLTRKKTRKKKRGMAKNAIAIVGTMTSIIVDDLGRGDQSVRLSRSMGLWLTGRGAPAPRVLVTRDIHNNIELSRFHNCSSRCYIIGY